MGEAVEGMAAAAAANQYERRNEKQLRRELATKQFEEARTLAAACDITLERFSETHYRLSADEMVWDVYPGNQRIQKRSPKSVFIFGLNNGWTLIELVKQAANTLRAWREAVSG